MTDVYVYTYGGGTYINLTNRCNNNCDFCIRKNSGSLEDNPLWLKREPEAVDVIEALKKTKVSDEVVFCGYGEPTMRLEVLREVAEYLKKQKKRTRLNTNGLGSAQYKRNIAPELKGIIDTVSISLNEADADKYDAVCHSTFGKNAYALMLDFARACVAEGIDTVLTVVDVIPKEDIEECRRIAADVGARLRVREYIRDNGNTKKRKKESFLKKLPFPAIIGVIYLVLGFAFRLWHPGWLIFILVPIYYAVVDLVEKKRSEHRNSDAGK